MAYQPTTYQAVGTAIQKRRPNTDHSVETIAFCADNTTARMLVEAIQILKRVHDAKTTKGRDAHGVQNFLEHAGII